MPRHHLVPQMLLKRFAKVTDDRKAKVVMVGRDAPHASHLSTVRNAVAEVGFYEIRTEDVEPEWVEAHGHDPEAVEKIFSAIESDATPIVDRLCERHLLRSHEERFRFAFFAATSSSAAGTFAKTCQRSRLRMPAKR